jgi:hypothetical protein
MRGLILVLFFLGLLASPKAYAQTVKKSKEELAEMRKLKEEEKKAKEAERKEKEKLRKEQAAAKAKLSAEKRSNSAKKVLTRTTLPKFPTKEISYGINFATDGYGGSIQRLERRGDDIMGNAYGFFLDVSEQKDPREIRVPSSFRNPLNGIEPSKFVYGKIANNYQVKFGYLKRTAISGKLDAPNIRVSYIWGAGLNIGIFKPYLLNLARGTATVEEQYTADNATVFLDKQYIVGSSGPLAGWGLVTYQFGGLLRSGFQFEYNPTRYRAVVVELGGELKVASGNGKVTMANTKAKILYPNLFMSLKFASLKD